MMLMTFAYLHRLKLQRTHGAVDLTLPTRKAVSIGGRACGLVHLVTRLRPCALTSSDPAVNGAAILVARDHDNASVCKCVHESKH